MRGIAICPFGRLVIAIPFWMTKPSHQRTLTGKSHSSEKRSEETAAEYPLAGGELLSAISNAIVGLLREHYGRGPTRAKTYVLDDLVVCVMRDGFTAIEQTMMEGGQQSRVVELRQDFQVLMERSYKEQVERLTGCKVIAFLSQAHVEPDLTIEMFLMDRALPGFGAIEIMDGPPAEIRSTDPG
jgi:uncharacterized protein YbcI